MPSELFLNSCPQRDRTNISAQDRLAPNRPSATVPAACKNPIIWFVVAADLPPFAERIQDSLMDGHRFLGRFSLTRSHHSIHDRTDHAHCILGKVDIAPLQPKQLALPQTSGCHEEHQHRSRRPRPLSNALISAGVSTLGVLRRFARWRTRRIGLRS
jgi:hypothetical protein